VHACVCEEKEIYSTEQSVFICNWFAKYVSQEKSHQKFYDKIYCNSGDV
jgi:hypothetical protein